jgi:hypothetical protein
MGIFDLANASLNTAGNALTQTVQPGAIASSMNTYMSPYISQVINDSVGRLRDRKAIDMNAIGANAAQSGAFGGSRHGLVEAETLDNYGRSEDELISRLLQQGFDTSAGLSVQEQQLKQQGAQGLMGLGQTATGIGQSVNNAQMQAGTMQQQLLQAILGQGSGQFDAYQNSPMDAVQKMLSAISGNPLAGNVTQSYKPGLFDYLGMATGTITAGK